MPDFTRIHRLGQGAFGEVWLVFDRALGIERAVKYVHPSRIHNPTEFYHEPRALMALQHPNIVRVQDAGRTPQGELYVAMEYLRQGSLDDQYSGGPIPLRKARTFLCDVSRGLAHAHHTGYIHRDIKPKNILVSDTRRGILSDFGLATRCPRGHDASPYGYMVHLAPEAFTIDATNALTDIYALGVTAYRILNGDAYLPVQPSTESEFLQLVADGDYPDRRRYRPFIPTQLRKIVNRAMHPDSSKRYQAAVDFRHDVERVPMHCTWGWKNKRDVTVYRTSINGVRYTVECQHLSRGRFDITTSRRTKGGKERRVNSDSGKNLPRARMRSLLRSVLTRIVTDGK